MIYARQRHRNKPWLAEKAENVMSRYIKDQNWIGELECYCYVLKKKEDCVTVSKNGVQILKIVEDRFHVRFIRDPAGTLVRTLHALINEFCLECDLVPKGNMVLILEASTGIATKCNRSQRQVVTLPREDRFLATIPFKTLNHGPLVSADEVISAIEKGKNCHFGEVSVSTNDSQISIFFHSNDEKTGSMLLTCNALEFIAPETPTSLQKEVIGTVLSNYTSHDCIFKRSGAIYIHYAHKTIQLCSPDHCISLKADVPRLSLA